MTRTTMIRMGVLLHGAAVAALIGAPAPAAAQSVRFSIAAQPLTAALRQFGSQSGATIMAENALTAGKTSPGYTATADAETALRALLSGTGLTFRRSGSVFAIVAGQSTADATQSGDTPSNDIVVTAQRRQEAIQDVPIAISAFTQQSLDKQKIEAGPDLLKAIPNVTFSKNNFSGYNFSIRGVGTKAVSVSTDPGVAIDFNSTTLITNRFFEQEFFDLERIEVLRGPQGTLYGRNATGGVVNIISNKPDLGKFAGYLKVEGGNFGTRRAQGAINVPVIDDVLGVRFAGAYTKRDGFTRNDLTGNRIDGRDLYTTRITTSLKPTDTIRADFVWERFHEDDNRARTAKQLCHRDPGISQIGGFSLQPFEAGALSQGCKPGSLYDDEAYGVPNGLSLPYVILAQNQFYANIGYLDTGDPALGKVLQPLLTTGIDPYGNITQTRDLRRISAISDPIYRAGANVYQLNAEWTINDTLSLRSQTIYNRDTYYSTQDYNRFNTAPIFNSTDGLLLEGFIDDTRPAPALLPGGIYNDPQLGRSNRLVAQDLITARSKQFSQELRLATTGAGPLQATVGANYTWYKNQTDYYVFINALTAIAQTRGFPVGNNSPDLNFCGRFFDSSGEVIVAPIGSPEAAGCIYIDPNPLASINGDGHNYFRSSNRYSLFSYGLFGDGTYALSPALKVIAGLRYNDDIKRSTPVPSQLLLSTVPILGGTVDRGYPALPVIRQHFKAVTGRAGLQWLPETRFTDDSMVYLTYSRGYKGGGTNPPGVGFSKVNQTQPDQPPFVSLLTYPDRFKPEYINSFEVGMKNTLLNGRMTLNATGYFYDYKNYQVSQIVDRSAINENVDATMFGFEFETQYRPIDGLALNANVGLQKTRIGNGAQSIDVLDRTQGNPDFVVVKAFPILPSNCVVRRDVVGPRIQRSLDIGDLPVNGLLAICPGFILSDTTIPRDAFPNEGRGFYADLGGNELPNAPRFTANIGAEYTIPFSGDWFLIPRVDVYHQSQSFSRVYNTVADRLRGWENVNLSLRIGNPTKDILFEAYVKNVFNAAPIVDTFVNSDDTGLPTNVFTYDPRIIGINVSKKF